MFKKIKKVKFVANSMKALMGINTNNYAIACIQLNTLREKFAIALFDGTINTEEYENLIKAIEETKKNIANK